MIEFHDPRASTEVTVIPYNLAIDIETTPDVTIGFLANGFPDSDVFLQELASSLIKRTGVRAKHWNKGNASIPASPTMLEEIRRSCNALIAAYGH